MRWAVAMLMLASGLAVVQKPLAVAQKPLAVPVAAADSQNDLAVAVGKSVLIDTAHRFREWPWAWAKWPKRG